MKRFLLRFLVAMISLLCVTCVTVAIGFFGFLDLVQSPFPCLTALASAGMAIATGFMALAPATQWERWESRLQQGLHSLQHTSLPQSHRVSWIIILLSWCSFFFMSSQFWQVHTDPTSNDPAAFLRYAHEVHEAGGVTNLLQELYGGTYRQANQHPLFTAILSWNPTFAQGKVLSLIIGTITLVSCTLVVSRIWNCTIGAIFSLLLATNAAFCSTSALVTCEGLLTLWISLTWLLLAQRDTPPALPEPGGPSRRWIAVGGLLGLAFLTKGTGPLFLVVTLAWMVGCQFHARNESPEQSRNFSWTPLAIVLVTWVIVASPLLTRNVRLYGNPIYNANSYFLFLDEFEDLDQLANRMTVPEAARSYLATHGLGDILQRESQGIAWESFIFVRSLGPIPLDDSRVLFAIPLLLFAIAGMLAERRLAAYLLIGWIGCFIIMFAWYLPIAAGQRFVVPLLPALLTCSAVGIGRMAMNFTGLRGIQPLTWLIIACTWCLAWSALAWIMLKQA